MPASSAVQHRQMPVERRHQHAPMHLHTQSACRLRREFDLQCHSIPCPREDGACPVQQVEGLGMRENIDAQAASTDGRATLYANGQMHMFGRKELK